VVSLIAEWKRSEGKGGMEKVSLGHSENKEEATTWRARQPTTDTQHLVFALGVMGKSKEQGK